jgi:hypothetical protein
MVSEVQEVPTIRPEVWVPNEVDQLQARVEEIRAVCTHDWVKTDQVVTIVERYGKWVDKVIDRKEYFSGGTPDIILRCCSCSETKRVDQTLTCPTCLTRRQSTGSVMVGMDRRIVHKCPNGCPGEYLST